jgi:hypothetical protein
MRGRFHPKDGQLYVCGLKGWGSNAKNDGSFQRVRYTGKTVTLPVDLRVDKGRVTLTFATTLDAKRVAKENVAIEHWNYRWTSSYGSKDYSLTNPNKVGRDPVAVKALRLSNDGKSLILDIPDLQTVMQMGITLKGLKLSDGSDINATVYNTINYLP